MTKDDFRHAVQSLFDQCAHYNPMIGGLRTFTDAERYNFFEQLYTLLSERQITISATTLALALLQTAGRHQSVQAQAAAILSRLSPRE
jgi:hypothetical protein